MSYRSCIVFCGNLPGDVRSSEVEDLFYKFGRIRNVDLKTPSRPPFFCFIEYEDPRDARDAVEARDGYEFGGQRLRVEISRGAGGPGGPPPRGSDYGGGGGGGGMGGGSRYPRERGGREPPPVPRTFEGRGTGFRAVIKGLPMSASWQDLKDHFRKVVKPTFTNVYRDRGGLVGVVEFDNQDDLDLAIRKLDDTEFRNPFDSAYIRIRDESDAGKRDRSRSRGRSYSRSRSRTPYSRSRSPRSKSRSPRSPRRSASRSPSRGRSKSKSRSLSPVRSASPAPRD